MSWPADNSYLQVKRWFEEQVASRYDEREAQNIARIVLEHNANLSRALLITTDYKFSESQLNTLASVALELGKGKPLQQITGRASFLDIELEVDENVLIPRPETEELVMLAAEHIPKGGVVLDIGTGTGAIALALKSKRPDLSVEGCDVSTKALSLAKKNKEVLDLDVLLFEKDILTDELDKTYDAIISNPPYIPNADKSTMEAGVLDFEPPLALFVEDDDPLLFYNRIITLASNHLTTSGSLFFECHRDFAQDVASACKTFFLEVELIQDLQSNDRMVMAKVLKSDA